MVRRRVVGVVAVAGLALAALTGCRLEAGTAAYIGNTSIPESQVDKTLAALKADGANVPNANRAGNRRTVVQELVFLAVAKHFAADKGYQAPAADYEAASQDLGLPATNPYVRTHAEASAYLQLLVKNARAVTPTEADYREIYQALVRQGVSGTYDQIKPQLQQISDIGPALSLRKDLVDAVKRYDVQVNPVYGGTGYPLVSVRANGPQGVVNLGLVILPLSGTTSPPAVVDLG